MDCVLRTFLYISNIFVEDTSEKGMYKFKSEYHKDDICEALEDIFSDKKVVKRTALVSRVRPEYSIAVHNRVVEFRGVAPEKFVWPELKGVDIDVFKEIEKIKT